MNSLVLVIVVVLVDPNSKKMQDVGRPPSPNPCLLANGKLLEAGYLIKERQRILV